MGLRSLSKNGFVSHIHTKKPKGRPISERASKANGKRSKVRAFVEHPFARMKGPMAMFIRTIGIARAATKIGMANLTYNMQRLAWLNARATPAGCQNWRKSSLQHEWKAQKAAEAIYANQSRQYDRLIEASN